MTIPELFDALENLAPIFFPNIILCLIVTTLLIKRALKRIPKTTLEAAVGLGCSPSKCFFIFTLPALAKALLLSAIICSIIIAYTQGTSLICDFCKCK